ncbi:Aspartate/glutamate/uridylate kinase [Dillenia turbinata]|uniref:UMP kinase n=1 Tax=Dillenia turbinata TaxID=194707 RepID=A0AAN8VXH1_9MAGN
MASCDDDDFALLAAAAADDHHPHHHHHHHQTFTPHRFAPKSSVPIHIEHISPSVTGSPKKISIADGGDEEEETGHDDYNDAVFGSQSVNPFSTDEDHNPFNNNNNEDDPNRSRTNALSEKKKDHDELSDGGTNFSYKKPKIGVSGEYRGDYRKDREEWSDTAIECLLDVYTGKFTQLNRGNLRGRDWEEVAAIVSERCDKQSKSVEQCKNKVDNLKKRYKLERQRMSSGGISASHWPWYKKMELIVGNSLPSKAPVDDDKSVTVSVSTPKQSKRYTVAASSPVGHVNNMKSKSVSGPRWRRVVFKISGAALAGTAPHNIDPKVAMLIAREIAMACRLGVEVAIVVGGRNFFCGETWVNATGLDRSTAYQIGMMATVMNSILLQSALEKIGVQARVQTAFSVPEVAEPYSRQRAIRHLEKGRVVIFGGIGAGTGNPLFSTDTAAALRASEIHADAVIKGTSLNCIYDCNSRTNSPAFEHISFREFASRGASSMDMMALTFCEENGIPVLVFNLLESGNISRALCGDQSNRSACRYNRL